MFYSCSPRPDGRTDDDHGDGGGGGNGGGGGMMVVMVVVVAAGRDVAGNLNMLTYIIALHILTY